MKKIAIILISLIIVLQSCKVPLNSINKKSFPKETTFVNHTDSLFKKVYKESIKSELTDILIVVKENERYLDVLLINDSLKVVKLVTELNSDHFFTIMFENGRFMYSRSINSKKETDSSFFVGIEDNRNSVIFNKKGLSYNTILDTLDKWTLNFFKANYTKFYYDTIDVYTDDYYSTTFRTYSLTDNLSDELEFLRLSIVYYLIFPEKMNNWSPDRIKNMTFLHNHLFDSLNSLNEYIKKHIDNDEYIKAALCILLRYIKKPNANDYRQIQILFLNDPKTRWIDDSILR